MKCRIRCLSQCRANCNIARSTLNTKRNLNSPYCPVDQNTMRKSSRTALGGHGTKLTRAEMPRATRFARGPVLVFRCQNRTSTIRLTLFQTGGSDAEGDSQVRGRMEMCERSQQRKGRISVTHVSLRFVRYLQSAVHVRGGNLPVHGPSRRVVMPAILLEREVGKPIGEDQMRSICEDMLRRQRKSRHPVRARDIGKLPDFPGLD